MVAFCAWSVILVGTGWLPSSAPANAHACSVRCFPFMGGTPCLDQLLSPRLTFYLTWWGLMRCLACKWLERDFSPAPWGCQAGRHGGQGRESFCRLNMTGVHMSIATASAEFTFQGRRPHRCVPVGTGGGASHKVSPPYQRHW